MFNGNGLIPNNSEIDHMDFSVSPIERVILTHDGTVMRLLEALTGQSVTVDIIDRWIRDATLHRNVTLITADGSRPLAWATSKVELQKLETEYANALRDREIGIGKLFQQARFETFREIVDIGLTTAAQQRPSFIQADAEALFERTYTISHENMEVMSITEYFPQGKFDRFLS